MRTLTPIFAVVALLTVAVAPLVVLVHNSGTQLQQYSLPTALVVAVLGAVCIMCLVINVLRSRP